MTRLLINRGEDFSTGLPVIHDCEVLGKVLSGEWRHLDGWVVCDPEYEAARMRAEEQEQEIQQGNAL